ncbi:hypothetical protein LNK15_11745, partial [Jeotgalicoccus huakuii]|nr:hypothetical protein [Jeotgalicoccus huakuii]
QQNGCGASKSQLRSPILVNNREVSLFLKAALLCRIVTKLLSDAIVNGTLQRSADGSEPQIR